MEIIKNYIEKQLEHLEKKGTDNLTENDKSIGIVVFIILYSILFGVIFLINNLLTSIIISSIIIIMLLSFIYFMHKDDNKYYTIAGVVGIIPIIIFWLSLLITLKIIPYRGDNLMLQRKSKIKILIRKTKINKLKFWK